MLFVKTAVLLLKCHLPLGTGVLLTDYCHSCWFYQHQKENNSSCRWGVSEITTTFHWFLSIYQASQSSQNCILGGWYAWPPSCSLVFIDREISERLNLGIFSVNPKAQYVLEIILGHFAGLNLPKATLHVQPSGRASQQFCMEVLLAFELLPSLMQCWDLFQTLISTNISGSTHINIMYGSGQVSWSLLLTA